MLGSGTEAREVRQEGRIVDGGGFAVLVRDLE